MTLPRALLAAWFARSPDPIAAALAVGLKANVAAVRSALAETRTAIVALRQAWTRASPPARSRSSASPPRGVGPVRRRAAHHAEAEFT
jgi:hypothetical protein